MSLLLEALKRAERAKRQQAEGSETPKLEAVRTLPPAAELPPIAQEDTITTGAPHLELDLSGLEAFEASLTSNQVAPALPPESAVEAALPNSEHTVAPLEFSLSPVEAPALSSDDHQQDISLDFPSIDWTPSVEEATAQDSKATGTPPKSEVPPQLLESNGPTLLPGQPENTSTSTSEPAIQPEKVPLTIAEPVPLPEQHQETTSAEITNKQSAPPTSTLSLETVANNSPEKQNQSVDHGDKKAQGSSLEDARNKARRLLGKPAPAVPDAPPPSRFSRRQLTLLSLLVVTTIVGAAGTYYVWLQMTPAPLIATAPSTPAAIASAEGNATPNIAAATTQDPTTSPAQTPPLAQENAPATVKELADNSVKPSLQRPPPLAAAETPPATATGPISIVRNPPRIDVLDESVRQGFAAYDRGDYSSARLQYQKASKADPRNRQAMLGLAATEEAAGNSSAAATLYAQALALDPRDPVAQAALLNLTTADPAQGESKLRLLLTEQPDRPFLYFALGNVLAAQQRWPEAEQSYFRASSLDSSNPDFAFNLAISLDQLHQRQPAREHYQRALELASKRPARFDRQSARQRLEQLSVQP